MDVKCKIKTNNTANSRCKIDLGLYRKTILLPISAVYTGKDSQDNDQTFEEWILEGVHAADPAQRFYPMPDMRNCEDNTEDSVTWTDPYGFVYPVRDGNFAFTQAFDPDSCLNRKLLAFNNQEFRVIIVDNENNAQVIRIGDGTVTGEKCNIFVTQPKANSATDISQPTIKYSFLNPGEHKNREVIRTDLDWAEMKGLEDLTLNVIKNGSNLVITFSIGCGGDDVTGEMAAISSEVSAWRVQTGSANPVPITTAPTYNAGTRTFTVATTALSGANQIGLASPDVLYGLGLSNKDCPEMEAIPA